MKRALLFPAGAVALAVAIPAQGQQDGDAETNWRRMKICAEERSESARHRCMDDVLRVAGVLDPVRELEVQRETFGQAETRQAEPESEPVEAEASAVAATTPPPLPPRPKEIEALTTTVADALIGKDRKLLVATAEGAVWKQTDEEPVRTAPRDGSAFEIEKTILGGFRCKVGGKVYRCERLD